MYRDFTVTVTVRVAPIYRGAAEVPNDGSELAALVMTAIRDGLVSVSECSDEGELGNYTFALQ